MRLERRRLGCPVGHIESRGGDHTQVRGAQKEGIELHPDTEVYWCSADVGWVSGHSYMV